MKNPSTILPWCVLALAIGAVPFGAAQPTATDVAADPSAQVPPVVYRSVFVDIPTGIETRSSDWKDANATVGRFTRGHADLLKWEEAQSQRSAAPTEAAPAVSVQPAAPHKH